jgi:PPOX class probable F420-dependent enzyme
VASKLEGRAREIVAGKNFAHLSVPRKDGSIQSVVIWADVDDDGRVTVNSSEGRGWPNNLRRAGQATISVANAENPYEFVSLSGPVVEDTHDGADEHIDALARKYMDVDSYPYRQEGEQRIRFVIEPERVLLGGG